MYTYRKHQITPVCLLVSLFGFGITLTTTHYDTTTQGETLSNRKPCTVLRSTHPTKSNQLFTPRAWSTSHEHHTTTQQHNLNVNVHVNVDHNVNVHVKVHVNVNAHLFGRHRIPRRAGGSPVLQRGQFALRACQKVRVLPDTPDGTGRDGTEGDTSYGGAKSNRGGGDLPMEKKKKKKALEEEKDQLHQPRKASSSSTGLATYLFCLLPAQYQRSLQGRGRPRRAEQHQYLPRYLQKPSAWVVSCAPGDSNRKTRGDKSNGIDHPRETHTHIHGF